jgi:threonine dehydratase
VEVAAMAEISLSQIQAARERIKKTVLRTPLVRFNLETKAEIYLKLECLQPTGSFKIRGAGNAIAQLTPEERARGVFTCSAGNMAQALAWYAMREGIKCTVIMPDTAPKTKLEAVRKFGAEVIQMTWDEVWQVATKRQYPALAGWTFVHPFADPRMMAGNGTAGLEILEDLPDVESVVVPFGGGGLFTGIATAIKAKKSSVRMYASEVRTAAPLSKSLAARRPVEIRREPSFVDGIGGGNVAPDVWKLVRPLISDSIVVELADVASAIKLLLERNRVVAEGAGASSLAAALTGRAGSGRVVCVISGGNIDLSKLIMAAEGQVPT